MKNEVPFPNSLSNQILPSRPSVIPLQITRPKPVPPCFLVADVSI